MFSVLKNFWNWFISRKPKSTTPDSFPEVMEVFPDEDSRCEFDYNKF